MEENYNEYIANHPERRNSDSNNDLLKRENEALKRVVEDAYRQISKLEKENQRLKGHIASEQAWALKCEELALENEEIKKENRDKWIQGYACALATLIQIYGINTTETDELYRSVGSPKNLESSNIDKGDLEIIRKYYK